MAPGQFFETVIGNGNMVLFTAKSVLRSVPSALHSDTYRCYIMAKHDAYLIIKTI